VLPRFHRHPLAIAILLLNGTAAVAAEADAQTLGEVDVFAAAEQTYKPVKASSPKLTQALKDTPRTVTVITEAVMRDQGATTLRDVLRNVSGISMAAGEGGVPAGDNLTIRGFNARTDIFIDGVRDIGGYTRDPFNVGSVEVFKGPSSAYSGRGSTGGSVNLVSKQPQRENFTAGSTSVGTDNLLRQTFDINRTVSDTAAFRLNLMVQDNDAPGRDPVKNRRMGVAPTLQLGQGTATRTTIGLEHLEGDNTPDYGIPFLRTNNSPTGTAGRIAPVNKSVWYGLNDKRYNYDETTTDIATILVEHDISAKQSLRQAFRYGRNDRDSRTISPRFVTPLNSADLRIRRELKARDAQDEILTSQTDLTSKFKFAGMHHTLVSGVEISRENSDSKTIAMGGTTGAEQTTAIIPVAQVPHPNPNDPFLGIGGTGAVKQPTVTAAKADTLAAYLFDTMALNKHWDVTAGVRFDRVDTEVQIDTPVYTGTTVSSIKHEKFGKTDDMFSWNTGVIYKPVPAGSFYLAYGTSFNPSSEALTLSAGTALVDPEESNTLELGTKWSVLKNRLAITAALFRTEKTNARTPDLTNTANSVLDGEQRVDGGEIGLVGQITPAWQMTASYTHLHGRVLKSNTKATAGPATGLEVETGNELANVPANSATLWNTYQINSKWQVGAGAQFVGERYNNSNSTTRSLVDDYLVFEAMAAYQLTPKLNLRLNAYNLTNERYIGTVGGGHAIPGAARSAMLTASYQF